MFLFWQLLFMWYLSLSGFSDSQKAWLRKKFSENEKHFDQQLNEQKQWVSEKLCQMRTHFELFKILIYIFFIFFQNFVVIFFQWWWFIFIEYYHFSCLYFQSKIFSIVCLDPHRNRSQRAWTFHHWHQEILTRIEPVVHQIHFTNVSMYFNCFKLFSHFFW